MADSSNAPPNWTFSPSAMMPTQLVGNGHYVTYTQVGLGLVATYLVYAILVSIYRLYFHPLRDVPGPKLAALTQWVETYYECFKAPGGQFMWEYIRWHEKYGPIVRIGPNEVHIQDLSFYETLYSQSRHSNKLKHLKHRFNNSLSVFATEDHSLHRTRRAALNPFFSKRTIAQHSVNIQSHMDRLCKRVASEYSSSGSVLRLNSMWVAFTADIVVNYCLEKPYDFIMAPDFESDFANAMAAILDPIHFVTQFSWLNTVLQLVPQRLTRSLFPPMGLVFAFHREVESQIGYATAVHSSRDKNPLVPQSLFTALLETDLPPSELSAERLKHEAIGIIGAGQETTMYALSVCSYHLLANPPMLAKLQAELQAAIPNADEIPHLNTLMQLPYLTAVVNEALRFTYGTTQRMPRLSPSPVVYSAPDKDYTIPVGAVMSMDNFTSSHDAHIFPEPFAFRPERWEGDPVAPDGKPLTRYLVAFGRGTRSCVGMQLAYAELYIGLASFFRRFTCELFETERDAVDMYLDRFAPRPKPGTKGVRVKVLQTCFGAASEA